ncbi:two-component system sensor histidine kinase PhcS [Pseudoduganella flava]|uniref:histidine kinase n=1 Tax=Pseudoduganella flava TaxID=871742 RepID=A0A562PQI2_9BURK|nr:ATP-binding protein [Pseudoduganella flava]QGZ37873.1 two-component sensor histidine kinase [Pseudoduganella flava]TWI46704.1 two-component system sensor histidine kinase PhcS [Pseudoduganella flava]
MGAAATTVRGSYARELSGFHLLQSRACAVTVIVLVLLGVVLDYAVYPDQMLRFALARVVTGLGVLAGLGLLYLPFGRRHVHAVTFVWLTFPQLMIAWMIHVTQGEASLFYAGIILTIFAVGTLFPVGYMYTLAFGMLTLLLYWLACVTRESGVRDHGQFLFHSTIILFAVAGSTVYTYYNERGRRQLFELKDELARKNEELESTNRNLADIKGQMLQQEKMAALGTLSAGLLHEVNNPVNFCMMAIDVAMEEPAAQASATLRECLADAKQGMQRVQYIVSDLKTFAYRNEETQDAAFLFERALDAAVRLVGHETKGIAIGRDIDGDMLVRGDEAAIIGVLINLLSNAALALRKEPNGAPRIVVGARPDGARVRVWVVDNGPGIPPEHLSRVFEPFFTTREVGQGLGLGLAICYSVVQRHGGLLSAESVPGQWTKFTFDLPRAGGER